jgi:hypothetical protein
MSGNRRTIYSSKHRRNPCGFHTHQNGKDNKESL